MKGLQRGFIAIAAAAIIAAGIFIAWNGGRHPSKQMDDLEAERNTERMLYYAPARQALEVRICKLRRMEKRWPSSSTELFRSGPISYSYRGKGDVIQEELTEENLHLTLDKVVDDKAHYRYTLKNIESVLELSNDDVDVVLRSEAAKGPLQP